MGVLSHVRATARHPRHADVGVAAVVFAVTLVTTFAAPDGRPVDVSALVIVGVASGVLAARRRAPLIVLIVSALAAEA